MFHRRSFEPRRWAACVGLIAGCTWAGATARADESALDELAWSDSRPEDLAIKLVTFGPGDDIYNYFGHNALIVEDTRQRVSGLYNFGMFSFGLEMLPSYMRGKLTFWAAELRVRSSFRQYEQANRSVHVQRLALAPARRAELARALALQVLPENRDYLYDHYKNNCSTRLRDLIDQAVGGQLRRALDRPARMSYREHTRRHAQKDPLLDFALVFWMNDQMERPLKQWDESFLPSELERQIAHFEYLDERGVRLPLVAASQRVFEADRPALPERPARSWPFTLLFGCVSGGLLWLTALWLKRMRSRWLRVAFGLQHMFWGATLGVVGTAGTLMWAFTEHSVTYHNENQWLANPLTLLWLPLGIGIALGSKRSFWLARQACYTLAAMSLLGLALKVFPPFDQDTTLTMTWLVPLNLGAALAHWALAREPARHGSALSGERALESGA